MSVSAYPDCKDSSVEWLGAVPSHWVVQSIKWLSPVQRGASPRPIDDAKYFDEDGEYAWVRIADATASDGKLLWTTQRLSELGSSLSVRLEPGQLFVSIAGTVGKPCITVIKACIHDGFVYFPNLRIPPKFLFRIFEAGYCYGGLGKMGTQLNLNTDTIGSIRVPVPPADELNWILSFLDRETAKIDGLVAEQERLIALLKEKRQAVISHAVTKGLNPNAPMKDSGIEWLGLIPAHWKSAKFVRVVSIAEGQVDPKQPPYSEMVLIAPNHVESGTGRLLALETSVEQNAESGKYQAKKGNVIYSKIRPALAKSVIAPLDCLCSADMYPLTPSSIIKAEFLNYFILSPAFTAWATLESDRVAMPKINREKLNEVILVIPPLDEQVEIVLHVDHRVRDFDKLEVEAQSAVTLLQERRAALISSAVTGKIDVRSVLAAPELETV